MMRTISSPASTFNSTIPSTSSEYWRVNCVTWRSLIELHFEICDRLRASSAWGRLVMTDCPTCGGECCNPSFCAACRDADARKARGEPPRYIEQTSLWRGPSDRIFQDGAPQPTVEALMYSLRERGTKALEEAATKRRLSDLSDQQVIEVGNRLQRLKPEIARKWTKEEVETLLQARIG
jgi:hypothetical protein